MQELRVSQGTVSLQDFGPRKHSLQHRQRLLPASVGHLDDDLPKALRLGLSAAAIEISQRRSTCIGMLEARLKILSWKLGYHSGIGKLNCFGHSTVCRNLYC